MSVLSLAAAHRNYRALVITLFYAQLCAISLGQDEIANTPNVSISKLPDRTVIELGVIPVGETTTRNVTVVNLTGEVLRITRVHSDCGCIVGYFKNEDIAHQGTSQLKLNVRPGIGYADFSRQVTLFTERSGASFQIILHGKARPLLNVSKDAVIVGRNTVNNAFQIRYTPNFDSIDLANAEVRATEGTRFDWKVSTSRSSELGTVNK